VTTPSSDAPPWAVIITKPIVDDLADTYFPVGYSDGEMNGIKSAMLDSAARALALASSPLGALHQAACDLIAADDAIDEWATNEDGDPNAYDRLTDSLDDSFDNLRAAVERIGGMK